MKPLLTRAEAADELREQAASCRRLALSARTESGAGALRTVATQFETDATRVDPSASSIAGDDLDGDHAALVRVRKALETQRSRWSPPAAIY